MKIKDADDRLWQLEFTAAMNQIYHEGRAAKWKDRDFKFRTWSSVAMLLSFGVLVTGISTQMPSVLVGLLPLLGWAGYVFTNLYQAHNQAQVHQRLRMNWTELVNECRRLHLVLQSMEPTHDLPPGLLQEMTRLETMKSQIDKTESDYPPDKEALNEAYRETTKRNYGLPKDVAGDFGDVIDELNRRANSAAMAPR